MMATPIFLASPPEICDAPEIISVEIQYVTVDANSSFCIPHSYSHLDLSIGLWIALSLFDLFSYASCRGLRNVARGARCRVSVTK